MMKRRVINVWIVLEAIVVKRRVTNLWIVPGAMMLVKKKKSWAKSVLNICQVCNTGCCFVVVVFQLTFIFAWLTGGEAVDVVYIAMAGTHQIWAYFLKDVTWWKNRSAIISSASILFIHPFSLVLADPWFCPAHHSLTHPSDFPFIGGSILLSLPPCSHHVVDVRYCGCRN